MQLLIFNFCIMLRIIIFLILSIPVTIVSWRTIFNLKTHGFYRYFSWECICWLLATNYPFWFKDAFSATQIISWFLLFTSIYLVVAGVVLMKQRGKPKTDREGKTLYEFEKTTRLVDSGLYRYIRHPLYSSLLFLTWGICMKNPTSEMIIIAAFSSIFLFLTALNDEKECVAYFGDKYLEYMKRSKRFVPFIF